MESRILGPDMEKRIFKAFTAAILAMGGLITSDDPAVLRIDPLWCYW